MQLKLHTVPLNSQVNNFQLDNENEATLGSLIFGGHKLIKSTQSSPFVRELKAKAKLTHTPLFGTFELTARCNLNCKMCYVHEQNAAVAKSRELSTEQWKNIFDSAIDEGMMFALLTGGECLLRDDFEELYLYLFNKGIIMSVNTNGILIDEEKAAFFAKYQPERIQISVYGSSDDFYEQVTGRREFDKLISAFDILDKCGLKPDIALTVSSYMKDCPEIIQLIKDRNYSYQMNTSLIAPRDHQFGDNAGITQEQDISIRMAEYSIFGRRLKQHETPAPEPGCSCMDPCYGMTCNAGTIRAIITYDGKMIPCMSIPEISMSVVENDFHHCWEYIWTTMEKVVQPPKCKECYYEKYCVTCPAIRYDGLFSGKPKEQFCELMVKKYNVGLI